jgi:hypothetical protein
LHNSLLKFFFDCFRSGDWYLFFSSAASQRKLPFVAFLHQQAPRQTKVRKRRFSSLECCFAYLFQQSFEVAAMSRHLLASWIPLVFTRHMPKKLIDVPITG